MRRQWSFLLFIMWFLSCTSVKSVPEPGAVLVQLLCEHTNPNPDELRVWVYGDDGALWEGARLPSEGVWVGKTCPDLGSVLIQPGQIGGGLRIRIQGWLQGLTILEGSLTIPSVSGSKRTFDLILRPATTTVDSGIYENDAGINWDTDHSWDADNSGDGKKYQDTGMKNVDLIGEDEDRPKQNLDALLDGLAGPDHSQDILIPDSDLKPESNSDGGKEETLDAIRDGEIETQASDTMVEAKAQGMLCQQALECLSGNCVDGVCCSSDCQGPCRSCNQPGEMGICLGYPLNTDPMLECPSGSVCNGLGACGPGTPQLFENGRPCTSEQQCLSGFCADGVCCNNACLGACRTCETGKCLALRKADDPPLCTDRKFCDNQGICVNK